MAFLIFHAIDRTKNIRSGRREGGRERRVEKWMGKETLKSSSREGLDFLKVLCFTLTEQWMKGGVGDKRK